MSSSADALDRLAAQLLVEARGLDGVVDTIEPLVARVMGAWEGPAADRLVSELDERRQDLIVLGSSLRSLAERHREEARRLRAAEAAAPATIDPDRWTAPGEMCLR
ncbi:MAG: hypothetical protein MUP13_02425 [Thermoanaerobaculales bacterium]|nr:hypothetical protein [Thermoanaerobaculales bacterium]